VENFYLRLLSIRAHACGQHGLREDHLEPNTPSGWFDGYAFEDWFFKILLPAAKKKEGTKVVIGDNLYRHISPSVLDECEKNQIRFICLPPNTTHITQPLDIAFFRPMKMAWRQVLSDYKDNQGANQTGLNKQDFPRLLRALMSHIEPNAPDNLKSGFRKCGIYPVNVEELLASFERRKQYDTEQLEDSFKKFLEEKINPVNQIEKQKKRKKISVSPGKPLYACHINTLKKKIVFIDSDETDEDDIIFRDDSESLIEEDKSERSKKTKDQPQQKSTSRTDVGKKKVAIKKEIVDKKKVAVKKEVVDKKNVAVKKEVVGKKKVAVKKEVVAKNPQSYQTKKNILMTAARKESYERGIQKKINVIAKENEKKEANKMIEPQENVISNILEEGEEPTVIEFEVIEVDPGQEMEINQKDIQNEKEENKQQCSSCDERHGFMLTCYDCKKSFHPHCIPGKSIDWSNSTFDEDNLFLCNVCNSHTNLKDYEFFLFESDSD
jgi:DDE superfamily endonuclease.